MKFNDFLILKVKNSIFSLKIQIQIRDLLHQQKVHFVPQNDHNKLDKSKTSGRVVVVKTLIRNSVVVGHFIRFEGDLFRFFESAEWIKSRPRPTYVQRYAELLPR